MKADTLYINRRTLSDEVLAALRSDEINSRLHCYRADFRASSEDAERYVTLWNQVKLSSWATLICDNETGRYTVVIVDR